jgi:glycosyltransferase involved in cell wall biosynthesis
MKLNLLFVASSNRGNIGAVVSNQAKSMEKSNIHIDFFGIQGKGFSGYLKNLFRLRKKMIAGDYDVVHAHYSLSGFLAALTFTNKPLVVSLMGSDVEANFIYKTIIKAFTKTFWNKVIVKSESMKTKSKIKSCVVIPNGVDIDIFKPIDKIESKTKLGWDINKVQLLFLADPNREAKNFILTKSAFDRIENEDIELKVVYNIKSEEVPLYINAADIVLLSSLWEGSPNIIKESMACNKIIVATDVGDISWLFGDIEGLYLCDFTPEDMSKKILDALNYLNANHKTRSRDRIIDLRLDSNSITSKIEQLYNDVIRN